jgi:hypothetical protein
MPMPSEMNRFSEELSLLVRAALRGDEKLPLLANKKQHIDQKVLLSLSKWHQVRSLLNDYLDENDGSFDPSHLSELRTFGVQGAVYNMVFLKKSVDLACALQENGVDSFLMKGVLWAQMLYDKTGLREFGDIDFFIKQEDIGRALEIFQLEGYQTDDYRRFLLSDEYVSNLYFASDYQLPLVPFETAEVVRSLEIQWKASYPRFGYTFDWNQLMNKRMPFQLLGLEIEVPAVENQLLMMIVHHAGVEQWDKLKYLADFVRLLRKFSASLDWPYVTQVARAQGFYKLLLQSLGLVRVVTGEDYSRYVGEDLLESYPSEKFKRETFGHWERLRAKPMTKSWRIFYFNMLYRDNLRTKLRILAGHAGYWIGWRLLVPKAKWYFNKKIRSASL